MFDVILDILKLFLDILKLFLDILELFTDILELFLDILDVFLAILKSCGCSKQVIEDIVHWFTHSWCSWTFWIDVFRRSKQVFVYVLNRCLYTF